MDSNALGYPIPGEGRKKAMNKKDGRFSFPVANGDFVKASFSKNNPKTCVEVARKPEGVAMRDSKNSDGPVLFFTHAEFTAFVNGAKNGEFDGNA